MLQQVFDRQRELMAKYHGIEEKSGIFNYQSGSVPVDIQSLGGQARIKHLAWYTVEELAEALDGKDEGERHEELADALHFFAELCIVSGYDADYFDPLEKLYKDVAQYQTPFASEDGFRSQHSKDYLAHAMTRFIYTLGNAMNRLKNKPWKQSPVGVDLPSYQSWLFLSMFHFVEIAWALGIQDPEHLVELYMGKARINQKRQESGY